MIFQQLVKKRSPKQILLLHGDSVSVFEDKSSYFLPKKNDLIHLLKKHDKSILLLAAPFAYTHVQETVHLKHSELLQADRQTLEFSRFPNQGRILESTAISEETAISTFTHLSEEAVEMFQQIKQHKLKPIWKPAISYFIQQYLKYEGEVSKLDLELIMDQEILSLGWKDGKACCRHLYFWNQEGSRADKATRAKNLLHLDHAGSNPISIDLQKNNDGATNCSFLSQRLLFPSQKQKQVKSVRRIINQRNRIKLNKNHLKLAAVGMTFLMVVWAAGLKIKLQDLRAERSRLSNTVNSLKHSTAHLKQMASGERSLIKAEALVNALKENSINPTGVIQQLENLLPETSWIQNVKINQKTIDIKILDTENSDVSNQLSNLSHTFGDVELINNSTLIIDDLSLRTRSFTIHIKLTS